MKFFKIFYALKEHTLESFQLTHIQILATNKTISQSTYATGTLI